jgi:uncharacterized membrane protein
LFSPALGSLPCQSSVRAFADAVSYLFIAIVWTNHHYLMRFATEATPRLLWFNFAHLFSISLLPVSTACGCQPPGD